MHLVAVELHAGQDILNFAIDADVRETFLADGLEELFVVSLAAVDKRRKQEDPLACILTDDEIDDLVVGIMNHLLAGEVRIRLSCAGIKQTEEVIDFGDGSYRRTRIAGSGFLVDGDDRTESCDLVHIGPLHLSDETARVGREGLHIAALSLGEDGVERQGRLARAAETGDDRQLLARDSDADVLEIVNTRSDNLYVTVVRHEVSCLFRACFVLCREISCKGTTFF